MQATTTAEWIGPPPSRTQATSVLFVGVTAIMIAGLQPLLLGALQSAGRLSTAELGQAATAELLAMGLTAGAAGAFLKPKGLRAIGLIACLALGGLDALTTKVSGEGIVLMRAAAGAPSGVMLWITLGMITRAPHPERWSGAFLTVQTLAQFGLSAILAAFVVERFGADGGFLALAAMSVLAAGAAWLGPATYAPLRHADGPSGLPSVRGLAALLACFLFLACIIGVWVYAEPLSHQSHHPASTAGAAISLSLAFQVLGGLTATFLAGRLPWFPVLLASSTILLGLLAVFAGLPGEAVFLADSAAFGFFWLFLMPFLVPMTIAADPTRRAALLIGGAQLLGGSLGPLLASVMVTDTDARGAVALGAACLMAATAIVVALHLRPLQTAAA
jgi:hypothetical protein